jgi:hypothetical protein
MPSAREPAPRRGRAQRGSRAAFLRRELPPAATIGALMGLVAAREGSGPAAAAVVGAVGCLLVLGMLALKRAR